MTKVWFGKPEIVFTDQPLFAKVLFYCVYQRLSDTLLELNDLCPVYKLSAETNDSTNYEKILKKLCNFNTLDSNDYNSKVSQCS